MPIRALAISIGRAQSCANPGWCTVRLMPGRAAAATVPSPIRTDLMRHERCSDFSATTSGRASASALASFPGGTAPLDNLAGKREHCAYRMAAFVMLGWTKGGSIRLFAKLSLQSSDRLSRRKPQIRRFGLHPAQETDSEYTLFNSNAML